MWEVANVKDSELPIIKLDNGRAVMVKIYYGEKASSEGMTREEYMAVVFAFALAKDAIESSLHDSSSYAADKWKVRRCACPWCRKAYPILDALEQK
jgi:hypothetical protein